VHLGTKRRPVAIEQREKRVRRGARDDLQAPRVLKRAVPANEVALISPPEISRLVEAVAVHLRQLVEGSVLPPRTVDFLLGQLDERI
jgi:hypothetical protein